MSNICADFELIRNLFMIENGPLDQIKKEDVRERREFKCFKLNTFIVSWMESSGNVSTTI